MLARQTLLNCAAFDGFGGGCNGGVSPPPARLALPCPSGTFLDSCTDQPERLASVMTVRLQMAPCLTADCP
jgi:hypothetical protein